VHGTARRPRLGYTRGLRPTSRGAVVVPPDGLWAVTLTSTGDAAAVVTAVEYAVQFRGEKTLLRGEDAIPVLEHIDGRGHTADRDYLLVRLVAGFALAPGASVRVMELPLSLAEALDVLTLTLVYRGLFGERLRLVLSPHPPQGLPRPRTDALT